MRAPAELVSLAFRNPGALHRFSMSDWDKMVRQARQAGLLARLHGLLQQEGVDDAIPAVARWDFEVATVLAANQQSAIQRELRPGNNVRITFNSVDAAHVASRHTWDRFAVTPGNADVANSILPEAIKAVDIEAIGARLLQTPAVQTLVSGLAPGSSGLAHAVDGAITYEVRVTLQSGINGMTTFYPITGAGVETLSKDAMRAIIWLWKSI